jgi:hypothetical protein
MQSRRQAGHTAHSSKICLISLAALRFTVSKAARFLANFPVADVFRDRPVACTCLPWRREDALVSHGDRLDSGAKIGAGGLLKTCCHCSWWRLSYADKRQNAKRTVCSVQAAWIFILIHKGRCYALSNIKAREKAKDRLLKHGQASSIRLIRGSLPIAGGNDYSFRGR